MSKIRHAVTLLSTAVAIILAGWEAEQLLSAGDALPAVLTILSLIAKIFLELFAEYPEDGAPEERIVRPEAALPSTEIKESDDG